MGHVEALDSNWATMSDGRAAIAMGVALLRRENARQDRSLDTPQSRGMPRLLLNFALARRLGSLYATFFVSASADAASGRSALTSAFI